MPEWIIYSFALLGASCVISGAIYGITIAVVRLVRMKKACDEVKALWDAVEDLHRMLKDETKNSGK